MLTLLEVKRIINPDDPNKTEIEELARLDLTENTEAERQEVLANARILYPDARFYWHSCGHDEGNPCWTEEV